MRLASVLMILAVGAAAAQDHEHPAAPPSSSEQPEHHHHEEGMAMTGPLGIPETRNASGTSWQPDSTPMHGVHFMKGAWGIMVHANAFAGYDRQNGDRGDSGWLSTNWGMLMETRSLAGGELAARQMLSIEPATMEKRGYPLLLQTGESFDGEPLHDRQHPHDLFMEIAAMWTRPVGESVAFQVYAAPSGEPALGPTAFPHRMSAFSDPMAPLGHHWQDSTHITFGVLTAGVLTKMLKVEASWFNGREPDDDRWDFDFRTLDSWSGRVTVNPSASWSLQASYGYLDSPEELHPEESLHRATASATWNRKLGEHGNAATTAVFGRNLPEEEPPTSSWLLETNVDLDGTNVLFGRAEHVEKTGRDLVLPAALEEETFAVSSLSAGYVHQLGPWGKIVPALGILASVNDVGSDLEPFYGSHHPTGFMAFVKLHLVAMEH
jgi:hypothetical protein